LRVAHRNNFDLLRVFAALLVIYGHQLQLKSIPVPLPLGVPISKTGLDLFFSISGYLVTDSWNRSPVWRDFILKRALRIMPGLIAVVSLTVLFFGPMVSDLGPAAYFGNPGSWRYFSNIVLHLQNNLPGVFAGQRETAVNGSLWSLFPEVLCYMTVPLLAWLPRPLRAGVLVSLGVVMAWVGFHLLQDRPDLNLFFWGADVKFMLAEACFFFCGAFWRIVDRGSNAPYRIDIVILICLLRGIMAQDYATPGMMMDWVTLPYLVIAFGRAELPFVSRISRFGDFSYGLYLYAYPIQRLMVAKDVRHALPAAVAITAALAFASWHMIEKPALRLKPRPRQTNQMTPDKVTPDMGLPRGAV
jgi:peptidoglycan/LPS O-acetylase OafA/YrhL